MCLNIFHATVKKSLNYWRTILIRIRIALHDNGYIMMCLLLPTSPTALGAQLLAANSCNNNHFFNVCNLVNIKPHPQIPLLE